MNKGIRTGSCPQEQDVTGVSPTLSPAVTARIIVQLPEKSVVFGRFGGTSAALVSKNGWFGDRGNILSRAAEVYEIT